MSAIRGEGACPDKGKGVSSDADVRTFWCKNLRIFRNLWYVRTDKGGGGQFFTILCDVFYGRPLRLMT